jgi:hypothetical protein
VCIIAAWTLSVEIFEAEDAEFRNAMSGCIHALLSYRRCYGIREKNIWQELTVSCALEVLLRIFQCNHPRSMTMKRRISRIGWNPILAWTELAMQTGEMLVASANVINHRTQRMANAGPVLNERDKREFALMGQEKVEAGVAAAQAMSVRMLQLNQELATRAFRQMLAGASGMASLATSPTVAHAAQRQASAVRNAVSNSAVTAARLSGSVAGVAKKGLKPIHAKSTANAKRLGKLK